MNKFIVFMLCGFAAISELGMAQSFEKGDPYLVGQIMNQMSEELNDIPVNIRRIAVYKINYNSFRFTNEEVEYIRGEVEYAFREYAGLTVLSPPELEPNDKMKIVGSDSTLKILNVKGRSLADVTPELLAEVTSNYGVQGLVELSIQRRNPEGMVISIRMMNPSSREIVWTKSFASKELQVKAEVDKGKTSLISFGVSALGSESIFNPDTSLVNNDSTLNETIIDLHATYTFRQPLNIENSAYVGFSGGFHVFKSQAAEEFEMNMIEFGVTYYQAISEKNEAINDYRVMFFLDANLQFPLGNQSGEMFSATPGLILNLSENLGLTLYGNIILAGETITLENNQQVTFNKIGYGLQGVVRF